VLRNRRSLSTDEEKIAQYNHLEKVALEELKPLAGRKAVLMKLFKTGVNSHSTGSTVSSSKVKDQRADTKNNKLEFDEDYLKRA